MTSEQAKKLLHGVYRIYWNTGGHSLASIGSLSDGERWYSCANWTSNGKDGITSTDWSMVKNVVIVESVDYGAYNEPECENFDRPVTITVTMPEQDAKALKRIRAYFDGKTQLEALAGDVLERIIKQLPE